jgi:hypothetical protein
LTEGAHLVQEALLGRPAAHHGKIEQTDVLPGEGVLPGQIHEEKGVE